MPTKKLNTIDADTLQTIAYEPISFLVDDLLPQGLHLLAGAPKIGKSWLALWLCLRVARGEPLWNFPTHPCEVLYLCLEDSFQRIQSRLFDLTEDAPPTLHFAVMAEQLHSGLMEQIEQFLKEHPATGLSGATDSNFVLHKNKRRENTATLYCTGRDIAYRELSLEFSGETHIWNLLADECEQLRESHGRILTLLSTLLREQAEICAPAKVLLEKIAPAGVEGLTPNSFSHQIRKSVDALRRGDITVSFRKSNGERLICLRRADGIDDPAAAKSITIDPVSDNRPTEENTVRAGDMDSSITRSSAKPSGAVSPGRGGSTERGSFRPQSEATDAQSLPTRGQAEPSSDFVGLGAAGNRRIPGGSPDPRRQQFHIICFRLKPKAHSLHTVSFPNETRCATVGGSAALRMRRTPCGCCTGLSFGGRRGNGGAA